MNLPRTLVHFRTLSSTLWDASLGRAIAPARIALTRTAALAALAVLPSKAATAGMTVTNIFSFPAGQVSVASLVEGTNGNFYGTTIAVGSNGDGAIFMLTPAGSFTYLVSFAGSNGATPNAPLLLAADGNFYGTTSAGGTDNNGTIFSMSPSGALTNRFKFGGTNGANPQGGLAQGLDGLFYGTTSAGGTNRDGEVFSWSPSRGLSNLYSFSGGAEGSKPLAGVVAGSNGNLYGTTSQGGANGYGTVFELTPSNTIKTLVSFALNQGSSPVGLVQAAGGDFYGATSAGGANGLGTVFQVTPSGRLSVLASFDITNGSNPEAPVLLGSDGLLYGTTEQGGTGGKGVVFQLSTNGGTINTLVAFQGTNGAFPEAGLMQASDGNFYGTTSSGGADGSGTVFGLTGFGPKITQQPTNQSFSAKATVHFSVKAAGSAPLFYQWQMDGANLTNTPDISGATSNRLTLTSVALTNSGSYSVIVSNAFGTVTSAVAKLTVPAPTLTIKTTPASETNGTLTLKGTAAGKYGVTNVLWQILYQTNSGTNWTAITTNGWSDSPAATNWSATVALRGGSNIFRACSVDPLGNHSLTNSVEVFYLTRSLLTLATNGFGSISPKVTSTNLVVGRNYTIKASPAKNNLFSNWVGSLASSSNRLTFLMVSNMSLTANFVTNPFLKAGVAGSYNGLFSVSNTVGAQSSGLLKNLKVGTLGTYTGKLYIGGSNYSLAGGFDVAGNASNHIARSTALGALSLAMNLDWNRTPPQVTGTVAGNNGGAWTAPLLAELAGSGLGSAEYTMLIPPETNSVAASPPGYGYATITNHDGAATLTGALADGAALSENIAESASGKLAVFATPYSNDGLLLGWLTLTNGAPEGDLTWIRPAASSGLFTNGYTNAVTVQSSRWTNPPAHTAAIPLPLGLLEFTGVFPTLPLIVEVTLTTNNTLAELPGATHTLKGTINPKTGLLSVSLPDVIGKETISGSGVILQNQTNGGGYFVTKTNAGYILLH
ncbi:MAG: choice-of-anchor tandem repeat GloVer-containing protein [Verrucomicrobiota bacterium]|jgi:uncharacterized repeat protein (TIGR03803 family)